MTTYTFWPNCTAIFRPEDGRAIGPKCVGRHNNNNNNNNNNDNVSFMELGHLLTRSGLTYPEISSRSTMIPSASWGVVFHYLG